MLPSNFDCIGDPSDDLEDEIGLAVIGPAQRLTPDQQLRLAGARLAPSKPNDPRRPPHSMFGRISDSPRVALPAPAVVIQAGCSAEIDLCPQRGMRGPYWLGMTNAEHLVVTALQFGSDYAFYSCGDVPGAFFDPRHMDRLIPIAGHTLNVGMRARVTLRNPGCVAIETALTLWGNGLDDREDCMSLPPQQLFRPNRDIAPSVRQCPGMPSLECVSIEALQAAHCPACGQALCGYALAERFRRRLLVADQSNLALQKQVDETKEQQNAARERAAAATPEARAERERLAAHRVRRDADFLATGRHLEPFEPGDHWESPAYDSD